MRFTELSEERWRKVEQLMKWSPPLMSELKEQNLKKFGILYPTSSAVDIGGLT